MIQAKDVKQHLLKSIGQIFSVDGAPKDWIVGITESGFKKRLFLKDTFMLLDAYTEDDSVDELADMPVSVYMDLTYNFPGISRSYDVFSSREIVAVKVLMGDKIFYFTFQAGTIPIKVIS